MLTTEPLISFPRFIKCSDLVGQDIKLRPLQHKILTDFWTSPYTMGVWCLGRRSGKTFMAALSAVYACTCVSPVYKQFLREHENYYVLFVANNEEQAKIALEQVKLFLRESPLFRRLIVRDNSTSITLSNGAIFKAVPNTAKGVRGYSVALAIMDEAAHYRTGSGEQTGEQLFQAIAPSIAQFGSYGRMLLISTPWTKQGVFYDNYQKGISGEFKSIHTANYPSWEVNTTIDKAFLDDAKKRDPVLFEVEYGANFTVDFTAFLDSDMIDEAIKLDGLTQAKREFKNRYILALDPALSGDAFTAAIAHLENGTLYIDLLHEFTPTFTHGKKKVVDIAAVEQWIMDKHQSYGFKKIVLDQFQSAATIQRLSKILGNKIEELTWTQKSKMEGYGYLKELFNTNRLFLYRHEKAISQLKNLQVFYNKSGSWSISGGTGIKVDDYCSVLAALALISRDNKEVFWSRFKLQ